MDNTFCLFPCGNCWHSWVWTTIRAHVWGCFLKARLSRLFAASPPAQQLQECLLTNGHCTTPASPVLPAGAGEVKRLKAYKAWAAQVASTPRPSTDPLAPPKKSSNKAKQGASDKMALVAAMKNKVRLVRMRQTQCVYRGGMSG